MARTLEIQECGKVESLDAICRLTDLRRLLLTDLGSVASIRCLAALAQLEEFLFYGSTNVEDGDLTCLTVLPNLENLSFQNRRHYTHRREEFEQYLVRAERLHPSTLTPSTLQSSNTTQK